MLGVPCLLLCKNCSRTKRRCFAPSQDQVRNWQQKNSATIQQALSSGCMIKTLSAAEFENATSRSRAEPVAIWKARRYIEEHSGEELSLSEVAKIVNISANHLSENFKQVTGVNFVEYVARVRFNTACDLLRKSNLRVSEIAFAAGFQSLSQFNRVFKRLSGTSPTQCRTRRGTLQSHR